jgi:hypothetical protein
MGLGDNPTLSLYTFWPSSNEDDAFLNVVGAFAPAKNLLFATVLVISDQIGKASGRAPTPGVHLTNTWQARIVRLLGFTGLTTVKRAHRSSPCLN